MFPASARVSSSALYSESQWSSRPRAVDAASRVEPLIPALSQAHLQWGGGAFGVVRQWNCCELSSPTIITMRIAHMAAMRGCGDNSVPVLTRLH